jgi:hypothetical protein
VDWRSSSDPRRTGEPRAGRPARGRGHVRALALLALLALGAAGCGRNAVRASEKEFLADQVMVFDSNGQEAGADEHILSNREGAAGGRGTSGGGCGCN